MFIDIYNLRKTIYTYLINHQWQKLIKSETV